MSVSIKSVNNGYIVDEPQKQYVFISFEGLIVHLKKSLLPKKEESIVINIEDRAPWAFKEGMD